MTYDLGDLLPSEGVFSFGLGALVSDVDAASGAFSLGAALAEGVN